MLLRASGQLGIAGRRPQEIRARREPCSTGGPICRAIADAVIEMRAGCMGTLIPTGLDAPVQLAAALERGSHVGMLVDQYYDARRAGDVLRPADARPIR